MKKPPHEGDLAWDLVDEHRDALTHAERDTAFVNLGVGDYTTVIRDVLGAVMRKQVPLSAETTVKVEAWIDCYAQHAALRPVLDGLAAAPRAEVEDSA
jgi:hypothetical protein